MDALLKQVLFSQKRAFPTLENDRLPALCCMIYAPISRFTLQERLEVLKASAVLRPARGRKPKSAPRPTRLGDSLAFHIQTGEVRRFVDVMEDEALDDLRGIRPAPGQAEIAACWGKPAPTGMRERLRARFPQQVAPGQRLLIPELVRLASFPVYGLIGNPLDLLLAGGGWSGGGSQAIGSLSLSFSGPRFANAKRNVELITAQTKQRYLYYPPEHDKQHTRELDEQLFQSMHLSTQQRAQLELPAI